MNKKACTVAHLLLAAALVSGGGAQAAAPAYPAKPIRLIVSSGAGGGLDFAARLVSPGMSEKLGHTVVVDNRAGASGSIGAEIAAHSPPDGYTLLFLSASLVVFGAVNPTPYDLYRDFDAVSQVAAAPYLLTVSNNLPVKSVKELIAYAKSNPAKLNFASTGTASLAHLAGELLKLTSGVDIVHVPYKGVGAALPDMLSGQIQMSFLSTGSVSTQIRAGRLRPLAIATSARSRALPEVPTMVEAGVPNFFVTQWHGMMAPRGTPRAIVDRLYREANAAVNQPDVVARLAVDGTEPVGSTPEQFATFLRNERATWEKVAKQTGLRK
jgi:tripartite-type tricarboxylate transporter receptor subunit TctC